MNTKHTPGNWHTAAKFEPYQPCPTVYSSGGNGSLPRKIAECRESVCFTEEDVANAKLIAAAPELLEALEECAAWFELDKHRVRPVSAMNSEVGLALIQQVKEAITKATQP